MAVDATPAWDDMVLVGRVGKPHGLRGHLFVNAETDFVDERFAPGRQVWTRAPGASSGTAASVEPLTIASFRWQGSRPVVSFDGYGSIEAIERLAGVELRIPESELQPLPDGSYYQHQLVGCMVVLASAASRRETEFDSSREARSGPGDGATAEMFRAGRDPRIGPGDDREGLGGEMIGTVTRVEGGAAGSLLVVDGPAGEVLIPLAADMCVSIDVDAKRIVVDLPEGLLEVNEPPARHARTGRAPKAVRSPRPS